MYDYVALRCFWQYGLFVRKIGVYAVYAQVPTGSEANYFVCNFGVDCCGSVGFSICHREPLLVCFLSFKTSQCMISLYYMISHLFPIGSMYAIYGNIYHQYTPNVSIYTIHGSYGFLNHAQLCCLLGWPYPSPFRNRQGSNDGIDHLPRRWGFTDKEKTNTIF